MAAKKHVLAILNDKDISEKIHLVRGQKVMLDRDLAELYGVPAKRLNEQVKRNLERFPTDFMFRLNFKEFSNLRSQIATSKSHGGARYLPLAFTQNGVAMLSSVLNSKRAIQVNIQIMRIFTAARQILVKAEDIQKQVNVLKRDSAGHKFRIDVAFDAISFLLDDKKRKNK